MANLAYSWATDISSHIRRVCDIGGGTGRALFELEQRFPELHQLVLVEPSRRFCEWARLLLSRDGCLPAMPIVNNINAPQWMNPVNRPPPIPHAAERLTIFNGTLKEYKLDEGFDLVTCLNVMDRHPAPKKLVTAIGSIMNDRGLLLLSSPLHFSEQTTPNVENWVDDCNALFEDVKSWEHVGEEQLFYELCLYNRNWTRYSSQVVGKRWRAPTDRFLTDNRSMTITAAAARRR